MAKKQSIKRIDIFLLLQATDEILGSPSMKAGLDFKQLYALSKLNRKLHSENKHTGTKETDLREAFDKARAGATGEPLISLTKEFEKDIEALHSAEVEFTIEQKIPQKNAEPIVKGLSKSRYTTIVFEYLIQE